MDFSEASYLSRALQSCADITVMAPWQSEQKWLAEAAFTLLMINLNDALKLLDRLGSRAIFSEDIEGGRDITDLVREVRNATCHNESKVRHIENQNQVVFCTQMGSGVFLKTPDLELSSPYDDDMAIYYGRFRIFLK